MACIIFVILLISCNTENKERTSDRNDPGVVRSLLSVGEHRIEIDGVDLWYHVQGKGPVLIVYPSSAGWGGDASVYIEHLKPLEEYRTVIYLEPRGLGKSERLDSLPDYSMNKYVKELESFRKKLQLQSIDLLGHCYGGMIAIKYAIQYEQHLKNLILISTTPTLKYPGYDEWEKNRPGYKAMVDRYAKISESGLTGEERIKEQMKSWYTITFHDYDRHKDHFEKIMDRTIFSEMPLLQFQQHDQANYDVVDSLDSISVSTLILYGDDDFPPMVIGSRVMHEKMINSEWVEFKDCSHWCFIEKPDEFFSNTIHFLNHQEL